jgi:hypothetical protein
MKNGTKQLKGLDYFEDLILRSGIFEFQPQDCNLRSMNTGGLLWQKITLWNKYKESNPQV